MSDQNNSKTIHFLSGTPCIWPKIRFPIGNTTGNEFLVKRTHPMLTQMRVHIAHSEWYSLPLEQTTRNYHCYYHC